MPRNRPPPHFAPLILGATACYAVFVAISYYITTQLNCPVFACTITPGGALAERLQLIPITVGLILNVLAVYLYFRHPATRFASSRAILTPPST